MGVDVEPGCRRGGGRCFSVVVLEDGVVRAKYESVPLHRLVRLVWEQMPDVLALDNVYELARDRRDLARVLSLLPPEVGVVQVTRGPGGGFEDVRRLARLAGLDPGQGKPSPGRTALLVAQLASMGYGTPLRTVEERTRIVVAKSRRLKHGGMSSRRYQRRVRAAILRAVKDIKRVLDRSGIDYDLLFRKSGGGLESAVFIVYAPRSRLNGLVRPHEDSDVRIEIEPVYRSRLDWDEEEPGGAKPFLIVGVDPGISTGIAALDLSGRPVVAVTRRSMDRGEAVELLRSYGIPLVVATDVTPAPEFVKKLAAMLRAQLYEPPSPLSVEEKREIFEEYARRYPFLRRAATPHVRDALAAAVKALRHYESKMRQIESQLSRMSIEIDPDQVKAAVIRGASIAEALESVIASMLEGAAGGEEEPRTGRQPQPQAVAERDRGEELELLRAENYALRGRLRVLEERLRRLEAELRLLSIEKRSELERDQEVAMLRNRLEQLSTELERLRAENRSLREELGALRSALMAAASGGVLPAPVLPEPSGEALEALEEAAGRHGRLIVVFERLNPVSLERHAERLTGLLLAALAPREELGKAAVLEARMLPVLPLEDYLLERLDGAALLDPRVLPDAYRRRLELLEEAERKRRERENTLTREKLRALLAEYRARRAKKLLAGRGEA